MKNITVSIDDETHRRARIRAAELGTSLSALVKDYLTNVAGGAPVEGQGVREMATSFAAEPALVPPSLKGPEGQPYFVNGKWCFTRDGKPRKPGALKGKIGIADDFDRTPEWVIDAFHGIDSNLPPPEAE